MNKEYIQRINLSIEYINSNLDKALNLSILAQIALYSPFHFHRLFTAVTGENPNKYVQRLRIERASTLLKKDRNLSISDIAIATGFSSNASFSKAFKNHYGISPSYLKTNSDEFSKIRQINSKNGQKIVEINTDIYSVIHLLKIPSLEPISVKNLPSIQVAYVNHVGPFNKIGAAYSKLIKWAVRQRLSQMKALTRFHDSPEVTDLNQMRQSACFEISNTFDESEDISFSTIVPGKHAVGKYEIALTDLEKAWQSMMVWVAERGLIPDENRTCYELHHTEFTQAPKQKSIIEIFIPVRSLKK